MVFILCAVYRLVFSPHSLSSYFSIHFASSLKIADFVCFSSISSISFVLFSSMILNFITAYCITSSLYIIVHLGNLLLTFCKFLIHYFHKVSFNGICYVISNVSVFLACILVPIALFNVVVNNLYSLFYFDFDITGNMVYAPYKNLLFMYACHNVSLLTQFFLSWYLKQ